MKIFNDKKNIIRIIKFSALFIITELVRVSSKNLIENKNIIRIIMIIEIFLAVLVVLLFIFPLIKDSKFYKKAKNILKKYYKRLFKPVLIKIKELNERKRKFINGSDEKKLVWNFNISEKLKKIFKSQEKINLKRCKSNEEKIRMLYIRTILQLSNKGYDISYSYTPKEIKNSLDFRESDVLFDIYEQVRYCGESVVTDDAVKLCSEAGDRIG